MHGAYLWPHSATAGDTVEVVASGPPGEAPLTVTRIGATAVEVLRTSVRLSDHELPPEADAMGCDWPTVASLTIDPAWPSGYYEVVVGEAVAFLVVRARGTRPLLVLSTNTWNAYNDVAGTNLYTGGTHASWLRPMNAGFLRKPPGDGSRVAVVGERDPRMRRHVGHIREHGLSGWSGSAGWPSWELPFVRWAESNGIELDYAVNADLERRGARRPAAVPQRGPRRVLVVGDARRRRGAHRPRRSRRVPQRQRLLLAGPRRGRRPHDGRLQAAVRARPGLRTADRSRLTSIWSDAEIGRPETHMTGLSFVRGGYHRIGKAVGGGAGGYTVHRPEHWLFDGTGLGYGDLLGAPATTVGYECDGCELQLVDGLPEPTGADGCPPGTVVLATAPAEPFTRANAARPVADDDLSEVEFNAWRVLGAHDPATTRRLEHGAAVLAVREGEHGTVVATGCTEWAWGLAGGDPAVERITLNLFERLAD